MQKLTNGYFKTGEVALDFFLLNVYWIFFTLVGGVIFGLGPATVAMYGCMKHKISHGDYIKKRFELFKSIYKEEFFKFNRVFFLFYFFWFIVYVDFQLLNEFKMGLMGEIVAYVLLFLSMILFLMTLYVFPIYIRYKCKALEYVKRSFILVIGKPKEALISFVMAGLILVLYYNIPGLVPVFGMSLYAFVSLRVILVDSLGIKVAEGNGSTVY